MSQIAFDERTTEQLEVMYRKRDALRRQRLVREALGVEAGHRVLDVGCGPGFLGAELLAEVGAKGGVVGVDTSAAMLAAAARRCERLGDAAFHEGNATSISIGSSRRRLRRRSAIRIAGGASNPPVDPLDRPDQVVTSRPYAQLLKRPRVLVSSVLGPTAPRVRRVGA